VNREDAKDAKIFLEGGDRVLDELAYVVFGAALEVHRLLGPGYLESVYQEALGLELTARCVPFERQVPIGIDKQWTCWRRCTPLRSCPISKRRDVGSGSSSTSTCRF
jgi:hypothetical protein